MVRAPCCEKVGLKKGRWTEEEDEKLAKYIKDNGEGQWRSLPKNAGLLRCGKSCRLRWINYLRADLKRGNISVEEENTIVKLHASFGNRWSLIASHLPGRTDNEIKNYWNSHLSRKIYSFPKQAGEGGFTSIPVPSPKRKGGRTSRWAMNKNKTHTQQKANTPKQNSDNDIIGLCQLESINEGSGELGGISEMLLESCGVWDIISEERESNIGESCSSLGLDEQHWDWKSVIEFNNVAESKANETPSPNWENQQKLLTWLWEDDDSQTDHGNKLVQTDPQIQNDIVQWILS